MLRAHRWAAPLINTTTLGRPWWLDAASCQVPGALRRRPQAPNNIKASGSLDGFESEKGSPSDLRLRVRVQQGRPHLQAAGCGRWDSASAASRITEPLFC
eukprot:scaffold10401_cov139-Isochrysis_galbana.AAC.2